MDVGDTEVEYSETLKLSHTRLETPVPDKRTFKLLPKGCEGMNVMPRNRGLSESRHPVGLNAK